MKKRITIRVDEASNGYRLDIDDMDFTVMENLSTYTEVLDRVEEYILSQRDEEVTELDKMKRGEALMRTEEKL